MSLFSKIRHFTTKLIMNWLNPEPEQQQTGTQITKPSSDDHIKVVYGEQKIAGTIVFYNTTNPDDGDDVKNDLLHIIIVWCEGGIESIDDILLNDISITDSKFNAKDGGRWVGAAHFTNGMGSYSDPHLKSAGWDAATKDHRLDGLACSYIRLEWSLGDDAPFTGVPDLSAVIRGRKVKNLETGATEYSENPAYCTLDYLTHPIFGKNLSASEYDLDSFKTAGLVANTPVPEYQGAATTKPLFTCNLAIDTSASLLDNVELLGKSMRALMPIINGRLTLIIEQDEEPTEYGLSESDFKGSLKYDDGGKDKRYNRVIVEYIDRELSYSDQDAIYPEPDSELADQWLAEDNGVLLEYRFKVSSCNNYYEARQMARIIAMISRESLNFSVLCAPIAMRYTVADVVPISHNKLGWDKKPFRLIKSVQQSTGQFLLTFREHQPYIYNWLSGVVRPPIPDTSLPDPRNVAEPVNFTSTLLNDGNVQINWESVYSHFDIQIYKNGTLLSTTTSVTPSFIISALDAGNYEMDVRAASKIGFRSQWVSFGFSVALPGVPVVNIDAVTYNTITLSASVTGASLGTTFEWQFLGQTAEPNANPNTASGYNYIYTGLVPDTEYSFKVRTKNLSGVSPWVDVAVKTSLSDLLDYIDDIPLQKLSEDAQTLIEDINTQVDRLRPETQNNIPDVLARTVSDLNLEKQARTDIENGVLDLSANYTNWRQNYEQRQLGNERLIDAAVFVDPESGTIVNRAFSYVDESFNEATLLINGVNANVTIQANRLTQSDKRISQAEAELLVQAGQITQRATFSEMQSEIAGAIEALSPAYSWQFNSNDEGFSNVDSHNAQGYIVVSTPVSAPSISYNADDNPMFRLRVRKHIDSTWLGEILFNNSGAIINVPLPENTEWQTIQIDATGTEGYTGLITSLVFNLGSCDIDFIEVGKRGANDLALNDITARTTTLESDINAATGIMAQYATTAWINAFGYQTQSNVNAILNTFDTTYQVSATLQSFDANGTLEKANNAQQFINGAEAYITSQITAFNAAEGSVDAQFSNVEQKLDAINGTISQNIVQVRGLELDLQDANLNDIISSVNQLLKNNELTRSGVKLAVAQSELKAKTTELEAQASQTLELAALFNHASGQITVLNKIVANEKQATVVRDERYLATFEAVTARFSDVTTAIATMDEANTIRDQEFESFVANTISSFDEVTETFASQNQAFTTLEKTLTSKINTDTAGAKNEAIATAQEYTRTAVGYCVDENGNISSESDAVQCVADGGGWVNGPLAEFIANLQISDGGQTASIKQLRQLFTTVDGNLVARGGWTLDNNGRVTGVAGYNDGEIANLDLVGDVIRQGVMVGDTFVPTSYVDNTDPTKPQHVIKGRLELGDGYIVSSIADIKAQDGQNALIVRVDSGTFSREGAVYTKTSEEGWNAGFSSTERYMYAQASARVSTNHRVMLGLSATPSLGDYGQMDFALYADVGTIRGYANGTYLGAFGTYTIDDVLSVAWDGSSVTYLKNGQRIATVAGKPTQPLLLDIAAYGVNDAIIDVTFLAVGKVGDKGDAGLRGSIELQIGNTNGVWYDSLANSSVPSGVPVTHDRVTIYKSSDPKVQTTKRFNGTSWVTYTLHVHGSALIEDTLDANVIRAGTTMTAPKIVGGQIITDAGTGIRGEYFDDGTYLVWIGSGPKNDSNAIFFIKKDTTGFVKGSFFSGQMLETKYAEGTTSASLTHKSAGNDVEITINSNGAGTAITKSSSIPAGASTYNIAYALKRGSTTIKTGNVIVTRIVTYESQEREYTIHDHYSFSATALDLGTISASYNYSISIGALSLSSRQQQISIKTQENLLNS